MSQAPFRFGRYVIIDRLSRDGKVELFRAKLPSPGGGADRVVVIKRLPAEVTKNDSFLKMFEQEIKATLSLMHPNITQIYDFGKVDGEYFIAMEYVPGRNLLQVVSKLADMGLQMSPELAAHVAAQAAQALGHAHSFVDPLSGEKSSIVHRDIHPGNVLVSFAGAVKLCDFSLSKVDSTGGLTQVGILRGQPAYFAPERLLDAPQDHRADIFSLGVVLWEILTGRRLFPGESTAAVMNEVLKREIPAPSKVNPQVPAVLDAVVLKALQRDPAKRYQNALEMNRDLQRFLFDVEAPVGQADLAAYMKEIFQAELSTDQEDMRQRFAAAPEGEERPEFTIATCPSVQAEDEKTGMMISSQAYSHQRMVALAKESAQFNENGDEDAPALVEIPPPVPAGAKPPPVPKPRPFRPAIPISSAAAADRDNISSLAVTDAWRTLPAKPGVNVRQLEREMVSQAHHSSVRGKMAFIAFASFVTVVGLLGYQFWDHTTEMTHALFVPNDAKSAITLGQAGSRAPSSAPAQVIAPNVGVVEFQGDTNYEVEVNGRWTPVIEHRVEVPAGRSTNLRIRKDKFETLERVVFAAAGEVTPVTLKFVAERKKGFLSVFTVPQARLLIYEGDSLVFDGRTPVEGKNWPVGQFRVVLENDLIGVRDEQAIMVEEWKTTTVRKELKKP